MDKPTIKPTGNYKYQKVINGLKECSKCKAFKPLERFYKSSHTSSGRDSECKDCRKALAFIRRRQVVTKNRAMPASEVGERTCTKCHSTKSIIDFHRDNHRASGWHTQCKECVRAAAREYGEANRQRQLNSGLRHRRRLRAMVLEEYGGRCACCGEKEPAFLCIDHVFNDGAKHRRELKQSSSGSFYIWLKNHGFPKDRYQLLCFNCNQAKQYFGKCPHREKTEKYHALIPPAVA